MIGTLHLSSQEKRTLWIAPTTQKCVGEIEKECMLVKRSKSQKKWDLFYDNIQGFTYKKGYQYQLEITETKVDNPPADASSIQYKLVKIIARKKVSRNVK
jgi:hypothetical protein